MDHDDNLKSEIAARRPEMVALRRHFHQHPETAFEERETAREIARRLRESGLEVTEGVGKTGVVGLLRGAATRWPRQDAARARRH